MLIAAITLDAVSLGSYWSQIKPFWIFGFYVIYVLRYQPTYAFYIAVILGLVIDFASSNILGQTSFALVIATGLLILNLKPIRFANMFTYSLYMLILSIVYFVALMIVQLMIHGFDINPLLLLAPLSTTVLIICLFPLCVSTNEY